MGITVKDKNRLIYSIVIILIVSCFTGWFYYINEPLHEDLGGYFDPVTGDRITSLKQVFESTRFVYMIWSGRIPGYYLIYFSKLFPRAVQAIAVGIFFSANVILTIRIVVKDTLKAVLSPVLFLVLYLAFYWFRPYTGVNYRWEFVTIYSFTVTFVLLYYNLTGSRFSSDEISGEVRVHRGIMIGCTIQLIGFITGMCHEILSFGLIALIGTEWIIDMIRHKAKPTNIFRHWGLALGYLVGLFAPGNLARLNADSTIEAYTTNAAATDAVSSVGQVTDVVEAGKMPGFFVALSGYMQRIRPVLLNHRMTLIGREGGPRQEYIIFMSVLAIALFTIAIMLWIGQSKLVCNILINDIGFIVSIISSIIMWTFVYWQPTYSIWLPTIFVYVILLEFVVRLPGLLVDHSIISVPFDKVYGVVRFVIPVVTIVMFGIIYSSELSSFAHTSLMRRERITYAQEHGLSEITVPGYDENLPVERYSVHTLNRQGEYDDGYYTQYYGVHLVIEQ